MIDNQTIWWLTALSIAALTGLWNTIMQRKHHKKSVIAKMTLNANFLGSDSIEIKLKSIGLGPALITNVTFKNKNSDNFLLTSEDLITYMFENIKIKVNGHVGVNLHRDLDGTYLGVGDEITMLSITDLADRKMYNQICEGLEDLQIKVSFESIYGDKDTEEMLIPLMEQGRMVNIKG